MQIQLEQIFNIEGSSKDLSFVFEPEYSLSDDFVLETPVTFSGGVKNTAGIVSLDGTASFSASVACSRCAERFKKDFSVEVRHFLATKLQNEDNDDYIVSYKICLRILKLIQYNLQTFFLKGIAVLEALSDLF